ncbi:MAG: hypothetical protein UY80_C0025G0011 [Parcubacteria group bacterium GW2011_GWB1_53_43]|nr:MAG: hypothetical protein UY80_C0025G0011 [Parcubacteria group bacterium GW2011_GWB1_53_43]
MAFSILNRHSNSVGSETRRGGSHFLLPVLVFSFFLPVVASAAVPADLTTTTYYIKSAPDGSLMRTERALVGFEINVRNVTPLASWQSNALVQSPTVGSSLVSRSTLYDLGGNWILDNQRLCAGAPPAGGCSNFRLKGFLQYYSIGAQVTVRAVPALGYRLVDGRALRTYGKYFRPLHRIRSSRLRTHALRGEHKPHLQFQSLYSSRWSASSV